MVSQVVKAEMLLSVLGSKSRRAGGFTLLELMVVVAMIAITTAVVSFTIPDPSSTRLEREAARLIALLESARTQARAGAMTVRWVPQPGSDGGDYHFWGLPPALMPPLKWLASGVQAEVLGGLSIKLGPEPVIGAQSILLRMEDKQIIVSTDGLSAFEVNTGDASVDSEDDATGAASAP